MLDSEGENYIDLCEPVLMIKPCKFRALLFQCNTFLVFLEKSTFHVTCSSRAFQSVNSVTPEILIMLFCPDSSDYKFLIWRNQHFFYVRILRIFNQLSTFTSYDFKTRLGSKTLRYFTIERGGCK